MTTIRDNAEVEFLKHLSFLETRVPSMRIAHISPPFQKLDEEGFHEDTSETIKEAYKVWALTLKKEIADRLNDHDSIIYLFSDGSVVIVSKLWKTNILSEMLPHLNLENHEESLKNCKGQLYEAGFQTEKIAAFAQRSLEIKKKNETKPANPLKSVAMDALYDDLVNSDHLYGLQKKRENRPRPVVMVVEDDRFFQLIIRKTLGGSYDLKFVTKVEQAVSFYALHAPDVVFMDIELPGTGTNGHKILSDIKKYDANVYAVMLSGQGNKKNIELALKQGAAGFIVKPFNAGKLISAIDKSPFIQNRQKKEIVK